MSVSEEIKRIHDMLVDKHLQNTHHYSPTLYHYTNLDSAVQILQSAKIRMTDFRYLNDPTEITNALKIANSVFANILKHATSLGRSKAAIALIESLRFTLSLKIDAENSCKLRGEDDKRLPLAQELNVFLFSLSKCADHLRQWLPYGDNGKGVAIGFKGLQENKHTIINSEHAYLVSVSYAESSAKEHFFKSFLSETLDLLERQNDITNEQLNEVFRTIFSLSLIDTIACKSPSYADEEEWRLFFTHLVGQSFIHRSYKAKGSLIRPYVEFDINKEAILEIKLGPNCDPLNKKAFELIKHDYLYNYEITESGIDYR